MHPEKSEGVLAGSLRVVARGDVLLNDGEIITLDDLASSLGVENLPYLEDVLDHIEVTEQDMAEASLIVMATERGRELGLTSRRGRP